MPAQKRIASWPSNHNWISADWTSSWTPLSTPIGQPSSASNDRQSEWGCSVNSVRLYFAFCHHLFSRSCPVVSAVVLSFAFRQVHTWEQRIDLVLGRRAPR